MPAVAQHRIASFGTFEVDLDSREIRKAGLRVRLSGQPFRLLATLLSRPGEIVTREELQVEIWGANTTVDFERGIGSAVNRLREALGDSADHPLYIETLARQGYRFVAPVSIKTAPEPALHLSGIDDALPAEPESTPIYTGSNQLPPGTTPPTPPKHPQEQTLNSVFRTKLSLSELHTPPDFDLPAPSLPGILPTRPRPFSLLAAAVALVALTALVTSHFRPAPTPLPPLQIEQLTETNDIYGGPPNSENLLTLATDGTRLYAPVLARGRAQLSSLASDGSESQPIDLPPELSSGAIADTSPDGSKLLVRSLETREPEQPLWVVPTTGSGVQRAGEILVHDATWMPGDPNRVLVAAGNDLDVVQLGTGEVSRYISLPGRPFWLRWSPDGKLLRLSLLDPVKHAFSLWEIDAATHHFRPLSMPELKNFDLCCGSWVPGSNSYVFQASDERSTNLWMETAGPRPQLVQLTNGPIRYVSPLPSRDGHSLFAFGITEAADTQLYSTATHSFLPAPPFLRGSQRVSFSRDGAWVAWTDTVGRLWRAKSDGSELLRLSGEDLEVFRASWSPDGKQLLLMARRPGDTWQIYLVSALGGAIHRVLSDERNLADPEWSADGQSIVFGREADLMGQESGPHSIEFLDLRTRQSHTLPGSGDLFSPRWSPDGQWIAALSRDQARLLLFHCVDSTWKTVYTKGAADPVWSPDSRSIYFHAFAQPDSAIMRADLKGKVSVVTELATSGLPSDSYFFSGITPGQNLIVKPRVGTGNLYRLVLREPTRY